MALLASVTSINSWALANARSFEEEFAGPPRERAAEPNSNSLGQPERADWSRGSELWTIQRSFIKGMLR